MTSTATTGVGLVGDPSESELSMSSMCGDVTSSSSNHGLLDESADSVKYRRPKMRRKRNLSRTLPSPSSTPPPTLHPPSPLRVSPTSRLNFSPPSSPRVSSSTTSSTSSPPSIRKGLRSPTASPVPLSSPRSPKFLSPPTTTARTLCRSSSSSSVSQLSSSANPLSSSSAASNIIYQSNDNSEQQQQQQHQQQLCSEQEVQYQQQQRWPSVGRNVNEGGDRENVQEQATQRQSEQQQQLLQSMTSTLSRKEERQLQEQRKAMADGDEVNNELEEEQLQQKRECDLSLVKPEVAHIPQQQQQLQADELQKQEKEEERQEGQQQKQHQKGSTQLTATLTVASSNKRDGDGNWNGDRLSQVSFTHEDNKSTIEPQSSSATPRRKGKRNHGGTASPTPIPSISTSTSTFSPVSPASTLRSSAPLATPPALFIPLSTVTTIITTEAPLPSSLSPPSPPPPQPLSKLSSPSRSSSSRPASPTFSPRRQLEKTDFTLSPPSSLLSLSSLGAVLTHSNSSADLLSRTRKLSPPPSPRSSWPPPPPHMTLASPPPPPPPSSSPAAAASSSASLSSPSAALRTSPAAAAANTGATVTDKRLSAATLILVTKYPTKGVSKTRLIPVFGEEMTVDFANAMLCDTLLALGTAEELKSVNKVMLFAPRAAEEQVRVMLKNLDMSDIWKPQPMRATQLLSSDLSHILNNAVKDIRETVCGPLVFIASDSPEMTPAEVAKAISAAYNGHAYICPATDGGYTLLALPATCEADIFRDVLWSHSMTCITQMTAISKVGLLVEVGATFADIDTAHDVVQLTRRVSQSATSNADISTNGQVLAVRSVKMASRAVREAGRRGSLPLPLVAQAGLSGLVLEERKEEGLEEEGDGGEGGAKEGVEEEEDDDVVDGDGSSGGARSTQIRQVDEVAEEGKDEDGVGVDGANEGKEREGESKGNEEEQTEANASNCAGESQQQQGSQERERDDVCEGAATAAAAENQHDGTDSPSPTPSAASLTTSPPPAASGVMGAVTTIVLTSRPSSPSPPPSPRLTISPLSSALPSPVPSQSSLWSWIRPSKKTTKRVIVAAVGLIPAAGLLAVGVAVGKAHERQQTRYNIVNV